MLFSLLVTMREGLEIALVVTILLGYLRKIDQKRHFREIWIGVGAATLLSLAFGAVLEITSRELSGRVLEAFEGFTMLFAVVVLTWMVFWMKRQSAGISLDLRHQIDGALSRGSVFALALLAFSAVAREGFETTLFLFAGSTNASGTEFVLGGVIGFAIAGACGVVLYYGAAKLPAQAVLPRVRHRRHRPRRGAALERAQRTTGSRDHHRPRVAPVGLREFALHDLDARQVPAHRTWLRRSACDGADHPLLGIHHRRARCIPASFRRARARRSGPSPKPHRHPNRPAS